MSDNSIEQVTADRAAFAALELAATAAWDSADAWLAADGKNIVPPVVTPPVVTPPVVTPPATGTPVLPEGLTYVSTLFTEEFPGNTLDLTKWQNGVSWQENGVQSQQANGQPIPGLVVVDAGVCNLNLPSQKEGGVIMGKGRFTGPFYAQWTQKLQKAPNGGLANSTIGFWFSSDKWPASGEVDPTETLGTGTNGIGRGTATLHYGANNIGAVFVLAGDWSGEYIVGCHIGLSAITLYGDVNGDGVVAPLKDVNGKLVQWTSANGFSAALGPWYLMGCIGVNTPGAAWWGETVVPGVTQLGPIGIYKTTA
jgi:hypothetical protein